MDKDHIAKLIELGASPEGLGEAQRVAAKALADADQPPFPKNGCAATLSALLRNAGIDVPMTLGAGRLAHILGSPLPGSRNWTHIPVSKQAAGDLGVTFDLGGNPGAAHIYGVIEAFDDDQMVIADNQASTTHRRFASGKGKTPTDFFLRAVDV